jgi:hypothetical protein
MIRIALLLPLLAMLSLAPDRTRDFDGIWNSATATPIERPRQLKDKPFFTPEEAADWERQVAKSNEEPAPDAKRTGTGTYNTFFCESPITCGRLRKSSVFWTEEARRRSRCRTSVKSCVSPRSP